MPNITMTIDDATLKRVRKVAVEKHTSLTAMVREFLQNLIYREEIKKQTILKKLKKSFGQSQLKMGQKSWKRKDLYE